MVQLTLTNEQWNMLLDALGTAEDGYAEKIVDKYGFYDGDEIKEMELRQQLCLDVINGIIEPIVVVD